MLIGDLADALERIAPSRFAGEWDNVGLLFGDRGAELAGPVLLTIDLTDAVLDEADRSGVGAVVSYHPPIFHAMKRFDERSREGRTLVRLGRIGAALFSPHTALDAARGGTGDWLLRCAAGDDAGPIRAMEPLAIDDPTQAHKLIAFVPEADVERVAEALSEAGAGEIGDYTRCSYRLRGQGTFLPGDAANPAIGSRGELEHVDELRLEMVAPARNLGAIVRALYEAHPYEEPAFDVMRREPAPDARVGLGRVQELAQPRALSEVVANVKRGLGVGRVRVAAPDGGRGIGRADGHAAVPTAEVRRIAVCPGAGASVLRASGLLAADASGTVFVTGELSHHDVLAAREAGCTVILAGHTRTERGYLPVLRERLTAELTDAIERGDASPVEILVSERDAWPLEEL